MLYYTGMTFLSDILHEGREKGTSEILHRAINEIDAEYEAEGRDIHDDRTQELYVNDIRKRWERMLVEHGKK
jgi:hypothetical protein